MSTTCRSCGEPISFIQTPKGRRMPVDGDAPDTFYLDCTVRGPDRIVTEDGQVLCGRILKAKEQGGIVVKGYIPHWNSCTTPERFRT